MLPRTVALNARLEGAFGELEDLFANPNTLLTIRDLQTTVDVSRPGLEFVAPYQTVCNYFNYFVHPLGEHQSSPAADGSGTDAEPGREDRQQRAAQHLRQHRGLAAVGHARGHEPAAAPRSTGEDVGRQYATPYQPAIDAQGNADCQNGQDGFVRGPLAPLLPVRPGTLSDGTPTGGNGVVIINDFPVLSGGTYKSRKLGINNLKDVDKLR